MSQLARCYCQTHGELLLPCKPSKQLNCTSMRAMRKAEQLHWLLQRFCEHAQARPPEWLRLHLGTGRDIQQGGPACFVYDWA